MVTPMRREAKVAADAKAEAERLGEVIRELGVENARARSAAEIERSTQERDKDQEIWQLKAQVRAHADTRAPLRILFEATAAYIVDGNKFCVAVGNDGPAAAENVTVHVVDVRPLAGLRRHLLPGILDGDWQMGVRIRPGAGHEMRFQVLTRFVTRTGNVDHLDVVLNFGGINGFSGFKPTDGEYVLRLRASADNAPDCTRDFVLRVSGLDVQFFPADNPPPTPPEPPQSQD